MHFSIYFKPNTIIEVRHFQSVRLTNDMKLQATQTRTLRCCWPSPRAGRPDMMLLCLGARSVHKHAAFGAALMATRTSMLSRAPLYIYITPQTCRYHGNWKVDFRENNITYGNNTFMLKFSAQRTTFSTVWTASLGRLVSANGVLRSKFVSKEQKRWQWNRVGLHNKNNV